MNRALSMRAACALRMQPIVPCPMFLLTPIAMSDIFISYSRKDSTQAEQLAERLASAGHSCWLDKHGIEGATNWSSEIVEALNKSAIFLLLLSRNSIESRNCAKELHLASDKQKPILPVMLEKVQLPVLFEYPLAGLQYIKFTDPEGILRSVERHLATSYDALASFSPESSTKLRIAVLPFHDQSPNRDNDWFADGMMDELIGRLGGLSQLAVAPRADVLFYKGKQDVNARTIAEDLSVQFLVEGSVFKYDEKIRIIVSLSDTAKHEQLWSERYQGDFHDIFDFQETVAHRIASELKLQLTSDEHASVAMHKTRSAEAYEFYLQAEACLNRNTRQDYQRAIMLFGEAIRIDPNYALALINLAQTYLSYYRAYERDPAMLAKAETALDTAHTIDPEDGHCDIVRAHLYFWQGKREQAISSAERAGSLIRDDPSIHFHLGLLYNSLGMYHEAAASYRKATELNPGYLNAHCNLANQYWNLEDVEQCRRAAEQAIPHFRRYVARYPDDLSRRSFLAILLFYAGDQASSIAEAEALLMQRVDPKITYNLSCIFMMMGRSERALELLERSIDEGFSAHEVIHRSGEWDAVAQTEAWQRILRKLHLEPHSNA